MQLVICVLLGTLAEIFFKIGAAATANPEQSWSVIRLFSWLVTLRKLPLTIAFPVANVVHILVPLSCWIFLGEAIVTRRWLGIALVLCGLMIVARPAAQLEEKL